MDNNSERPEEEAPLADRLTGPILSRLRQTVALLLWQHQAVRVNTESPFRLASGNMSPIYIDCRRVISDPSFMRLFNTTATMILERRQARFTAVAGGETAGIPYGAYLASALSLPFVYIRKKAKAYGTGSRIEGELAAGSQVLLVEDLITDGGSKVSFLYAVADAGGKVSDVLVLFDRQQGGKELLAEQGVELHSVCDRATAFAMGNSSALMSDDDRRSCNDYFRDPRAWHSNRGFEFQG